MAIIITGGTGLLGSALAGALVQRGREVIILSRRPAGAFETTGGQVRTVQWDARTGQGWSALAEGAEALVNLAGENLFGLPWTAKRRERIRQSRVLAGQAVVDAVSQTRVKPRMVLQASAVGYYGQRGDEEVSEATPPGNDFLAQVCRAWEASSQPVEDMGVRRVVTRTGLPLTLRGGVLPLMRLPFLFFAGGRLGNGRQFWPWLHVQDQVAALIYLIEHDDAGGVFNLMSPNPARAAEIAQAIGRVMHRPSWFPVPGVAMRLVMGEMAEIALGSIRAYPRRLEQAGFTFRYPTLEPALRDLLTR